MVDSSRETVDDVEFTRLVLDQLANKWTVRIMWAYCPDMQPIRFNDLRRRLGGITQKVLSEHLRRLERSGILERRVLSTRPLAVEYAVTPLGHSLRRPVSILYGWAREHAVDVRASQLRHDQSLARHDEPLTP
ncbi:transcriptional regulator, HxlR family [Plantibacter sp. VKM Ac-1784]|uniref:Transcriptional regulator, HxlR family n=1 Tax=Plantibacter elymi (nom. nud.) TaxID=199708 RepID=A0ABY1RE57_9MICO|nr:helix-turn-helix domain-containing protein [Plantibacter sp. VKM Ac-1784]SMQ71270.1 transcriptional regulator, HxlR family [Plantibacter sp. VKM Ac-1784]